MQRRFAHARQHHAGVAHLGVRVLAPVELAVQLAVTIGVDREPLPAGLHEEARSIGVGNRDGAGDLLEGVCGELDLPGPIRLHIE